MNTYLYSFYENLLPKNIQYLRMDKNPDKWHDVQGRKEKVLPYNYNGNTL